MTVAGDWFSAPVAFGGFIALIAAAGILILWYESPRHTWWRERVRQWVHRLTSRSDLDWVDARLLTVLAAIAFAASELVFWSAGGFDCIPSGPPDLTTLLASGRAFLSGGNPFTITACGRMGNPVPAGMASVLLDALGSLAGPVGILLVWGSVSVAMIPLLWALGGAQRAVATVFVLSSFLYLPLVVQVDGATLALVPVAVLLVLYLARRGWVGALMVGGFLATGRFPALFPAVGASGRAGVRRTIAAVAGVGIFVTVTLATIAVYGSRFTGPVFFSQFARTGFALNYWGVLQGEGWLAPSTVVTIVQGALTIVLVAVCWLWGRSELGAAAIVLTGTILLTQFLSTTELVFLAPVALMGTRARWWLWTIGLVATTNALLALRSLAWVWGFSYALDLLLTALLLGLLIELLRTEIRVSRLATHGPSRSVAGSPATVAD